MKIYKYNEEKGFLGMIQGIGLDIIEIQRIKQVSHKNERFVYRILTQNERNVYFELPTERRRLEFLAGRFAAKEAFAKATGQGLGKIGFQQIEILAEENEAPQIKVKGYERKQIFISITHSEQYAMAQVIITSIS